MDSRQVLESIKLWTLQQTQKPCLINIAGGSCTGKSYLTDQLRSYLSCKPAILNLDLYFLDFTDPKLPRDTDGFPIFDEPSSYHSFEIVETVTALLQNRQVQVPLYNLAKNLRTSFFVLEPEPVIIADGLFAIDTIRFLKPSLNIYIEADKEICIKRRVERDAVRFGISEDLIRKHYERRIYPRLLKFIEPQKQFADYVINTS